MKANLAEKCFTKFIQWSEKFLHLRNCVSFDYVSYIITIHKASLRQCPKNFSAQTQTLLQILPSKNGKVTFFALFDVC